MRRDQLFHRWIKRQPADGVSGRFWSLCQAAGVDLSDLQVGQPPTYMDYEEELLAALSAHSLMLETLQGQEEAVREAVGEAERSLVPGGEAKKLLRSAWRSWLIHFQREKKC